jgi:hypothetical protein
MTIVQSAFVAVFILAAVFGFMLGRWSVRRSFVDVTQTYETLARAAESDVPWDMLWARFDSVDVNMRRIVQEELDARMSDSGSEG